MSSGKNLSGDIEIEQHIRALGASTSRVRFTMLTLAIACVAAVVTLWGERPDAWAKDRLQKFAHYRVIAKECNFFSDSNCKDGTICLQMALSEDYDQQLVLLRQRKLSQECRDAEAEHALRWLYGYGLKTQADADRFAEKQWEYFFQNVIAVRVPVLGLSFDINDLGLMTGATLLFIMIIMFYSTHRAHENLVLAMWKVKELCRNKRSFNQEGSEANLLYHALAMEQVFTVPPTLARWNDFLPIRLSHYALFALPTAVQLSAYFIDRRSAMNGEIVSPHAMEQSLRGQIVLILLVALASVASVLHLWADDKEWSDAFYYINPSHRHKIKLPWRHWVRLINNSPPAGGLVGVVGDNQALSLYFSDTVRNRTMLLSRAFLPQEGEGGSQLTISLSTYSANACRNLYLKDNVLHGILPITNDWSQQNETERVVVGSAFPGPEGIDIEKNFSGYLEHGGAWYVFSDYSIEKFDKKGKQIWLAGNSSHQLDGTREAAGFHRISGRAFNEIDDKRLEIFVTDGAWVRHIDQDGQVSTWGGRPLGRFNRREPPYLLGLTYVEGREGDPGPSLLVCDFSLRRVFRVWSREVEEVYRSPRGWSPAGIWFNKDTCEVYLMEYAVARFRYRVIPKNIIGSYLRIRHGFLGQISSLTDFKYLSRFRGWKADHSPIRER